MADASSSSMSPYMLGAGMGLSALGGFMGADADRKGRHEAQDLSIYNGYGGIRNLGGRLYGDGFGLVTDPKNSKIIDHFNFPNQPAAGSLLGKLGSLGDLYGQRAQGIRGQFDAGMAGLDNLYGSSEGMARQYGQGGEALIDQETQKALKGANQTAGASLAASGFGNSTAGANAMNQNAKEFGRQAGEQKLSLRAGALDRVLGVRGQRAAAQNQNIGRRADLGTSTLSQELGYKQLPIQTELAALQGPVMNPMANINYSQFVPQYSGGGTALSTAGNALGTLGGYGMLKDLYGNKGPSSGDLRTMQMADY